MTVAYDGTDFAGFQVQGDRRTVQGTLQAGFEQILGDPTPVEGAGRTDAGVHATGQVISLRTESEFLPEDLQRALNAVLPADVAVRDVAEASAGFHARFRATSREYRYTIWNAPVRLALGRQYWYHWRAFLDVPAMDNAARALVGRHDFAAFCGATRGREHPLDTIRTLFRCHCWRDGDQVRIDVAADAFLPRMVRNLVGTLIPVGMRQATADEVRAIFRGRDRRRAGPTAPASGLCLTRVSYY